MGKGDKRTRRGKIWQKTYGKLRPKKKNENKKAKA
jgi:30S ribosomal protein S31